MGKYKSEQKAIDQYDSSQYRTPDGYTSDIVIFTIISKQNEMYKPPSKTLKLMLIKRTEKDAGDEPNIEGGKWALPGGFIHPSETAFEAAKRELEEETGVTGIRVKHFGVYDKPERDPRGWIISNAHYAIVTEEYLSKRKAADDASEVELFELSEVFGLNLAFDHRQIIEDALWFIRKDMALTTLAKNFLPGEFVLSELQGVLLTVLDDPSIKLDAAFFRKAPTLPFIEKVTDSSGNPKKSNKYSKTPAQLYCFNDYQPFVSVYQGKS
ncbi:NUDIX domain-containing protein [Bacillus sp. CGMCC 1.16607]|uniref:NUDIX domain-containing protein n=1 Tax=Bacillus sp. CGMCC 1.16607 TaxID=3351842 RepID=UPI0036368628